MAESYRVVPQMSTLGLVIVYVTLTVLALTAYAMLLSTLAALTEMLKALTVLLQSKDGSALSLRVFSMQFPAPHTVAAKHTGIMKGPNNIQ